MPFQSYIFPSEILKLCIFFGLKTGDFYVGCMNPRYSKIYKVMSLHTTPKLSLHTEFDQYLSQLASAGLAQRVYRQTTLRK